MSPAEASDAGTGPVATTRPPEGMGGLAKGLAVIEAFAARRSPLTVTLAATATGTTPAAARRCLLTLTELGYLTHEDRLFHPTPRMTRLGLAYLDTSPLPSLAQPYLTAARDEMDESVSLAVLEDQWSIFVARAEAPRIVATGVRVGARLPAHASATGRVLLAALPDTEVDAILRSSSRQASTRNTLTSLQSLRRRVQETRDAGYGYTDEELELGMRTLAVPVRDVQGAVRAAMSVSAFTARVSMKQMVGQFRQILVRESARLARTL